MKRRDFWYANGSIGGEGGTMKREEILAKLAAGEIKAHDPQLKRKPK